VNTAGQDNRKVLPADAALGFWLKPIAPEDMPMIAAHLLADGYDTPSLREAAGFGANDDPRDIRDAFRQALAELGVWLPDRTTAYAQLSRGLAAAVISGEISVDECARRLCASVELDEVIYHALPATAETFARMCWLHGSELYDDNGGEQQLLAAAAALAASQA
jgi:hypothetical protein